MENTNWSTLYLPFQEFIFTQKSDATLTSSWMFSCVFWASRETGIGAEASQKDDEVPFSSYKKLPLSHSGRRLPAGGGSHHLLVKLGPTGHFGSLPAITPPGSILSKNILTAGQVGEVAGGCWKSAVVGGQNRVKFPTLTSSLSHPKLVQILKLDRSVSAVWLWFKYRRINADTDSPSQSVCLPLRLLSWSSILKQNLEQ